MLIAEHWNFPKYWTKRMKKPTITKTIHHLMLTVLDLFLKRDETKMLTNRDPHFLVQCYDQVKKCKYGIFLKKINNYGKFLKKN